MSNLLKEYIELLIEAPKELVSYKQIGSMINDALVSLGANVSRVKCSGPETKGGDHCRVFLNDLKEKTPKELSDLAKKSIEVAFGGRATVQNIGQVHSGKLDTYQVSSKGNVYNVVFSGGLTTGQRGGGYEYEGEVKKLLGIGGAQAEDVGADTTLSDVYVKTDSGQSIGIEIKGAGAKFGQPTLQYNYLSGLFLVPPASRSSKNAKLVVDILNASDDEKLRIWLRRIRAAWNKLHPESRMTVLSTQIQSDDWAVMIKSGISQSGPSVQMQVFDIVKYYKKKKANYIQIQGKGLYSFNDVLKLGVTSFSEAASNLNAFIKPEILLSGGNKVLRASISLDYRTLTESNMDLAKPADAQKFSKALKSH